MMLIDVSAPAAVSPGTDDRTLVGRVIDLARKERELRADFIVHLAELDERRIYLQDGYPTLFAWLTEKLRFSNASAFRRATAARLQARLPAVASYLHEGRLTLTKLCRLRDVLAPENCLALLEQAATMTEKEVEELALVLDPKRLAAPPRDSIRPLPPLPLPLPLPSPPASPPPGDLFAPPPGAAPAPMTPEPAPAPAPAPIRHAIKMTVGPEFMTLLEEVRAALSHSHPGAQLEALLGHCMKETLNAYRKRTRAETDRPRKASGRRDVTSRDVPAEVRRAVWKRDEGRCTFVSEDGHRCNATHLIEVHHDQPFGRGGPTTVENCRLACKPHNDLMARADYGDTWMDRCRRRPRDRATGAAAGASAVND